MGEVTEVEITRLVWPELEEALEESSEFVAGLSLASASSDPESMSRLSELSSQARPGQAPQHSRPQRQ